MSRAARRPVTARELAVRIGCEIVGDAERLIGGVSGLDSASASDLCFFSDAAYREKAKASSAGFVLVRSADDAAESAIKLVHPNPHAAFAQALDVLFPAIEYAQSIAVSAVVSPTAITTGATLHACVVIGERSKVGEGSVIHANTTVGSDVSIGRDCIVYPGVNIYDGCTIGHRAIIHSGTVIGSDGFGFQPSATGWIKVQQVGTVVIGNDVEIGANCTIDRGAIDDTVIGNDVKMDNQVHIAHNCRIGNHTAIAGCAGLAGSTIIGERCMLGGATRFTGHLSVCDDSIVSGGTIVTSSITEKGRTTGIFPATSHHDWTKIAATLRRSIKKKSSESM
jgi:UDP-3-O-[3-hydroxymyristoyl] glucosamine N-acyltransferase